MGDTYGVTPQGFVVKPLDQCLTELQALARASFGQGIKLNPSSKWGQFLAILAERESEIWDLGQEVYASRDPDQATGAGLEAICAITGVIRNEATRSTVTATLGGVAGTIIAAGKVASVAGAGGRFRLQAQATIGVGGTVDAVLEAEETGPVFAPAGSLTVIETPVAGWVTVTNAADAEVGTSVEKDPALRQRRELSLAIAGTAIADAILAEVARVKDVSSVAVYVNDDDVVDAQGLEPHSVEVIVSGGTDAAVAAAVWRSKAGGIRSQGTTSVVVQDAAGHDQVVSFSRPVLVPIYLALVIEKGEKYSTASPPDDGDSLVKQALVDWGLTNLTGGTSVYPRAMLPAVFGVAGVKNVPTIAVGLAPVPASEAPIVLTARERAQIDATRITIAGA